MPDTETTAERNKWRSGIERRISALESSLIRSLVIAACGLIALGSVLPVYSGVDGDIIPTMRLATAPFTALSAADQPSDRAYALVAGIGLLGLLSCVVVALGVGAVQCGRNARRSTLRTAKVVFWLMLVGSLFPLLAATTVVAENLSGEPGPAMWCFLPGLLLFAVTVFNRYLRDLWCVETRHESR